MNSVEEKLIRAAVEAASRAYAPYSQFPVGAALVADNGRIFTGCNVENASYGLTICAERAAVAAAVTAGCRCFIHIAIAAGTGGEPATPCGACRQILSEFADPDMDCLLVTLDQPGQVRRFRLDALLPHAFSLKA
ncbi:MAG: cytidine deaminase [Kiritimatiellia bacterium]